MKGGGCWNGKTSGKVPDPIIEQFCEGGGGTVDPASLAYMQEISTPNHQVAITLAIFGPLR